jgi:hypothetical protein
MEAAGCPLTLVYSYYKKTVQSQKVVILTPGVYAFVRN